MCEDDKRGDIITCLLLMLMFLFVSCIGDEIESDLRMGTYELRMPNVCMMSRSRFEYKGVRMLV